MCACMCFPLAVPHSAKQKELTGEVLQSQILILACYLSMEMSVFKGISGIVTISVWERGKFKTIFCASYLITPSLGPIESMHFDTILD